MSAKLHEFKVGDRVQNTFNLKIGTVVEGMIINKRDIPVKWDHVKYDEIWRYSVPSSYLLRKLTKLERALH